MVSRHTFILTQNAMQYVLPATTAQIHQDTYVQLVMHRVVDAV